MGSSHGGAAVSNTDGRGFDTFRACSGTVPDTSTLTTAHTCCRSSTGSSAGPSSRRMRVRVPSTARSSTSPNGKGAGLRSRRLQVRPLPSTPIDQLAVAQRDRAPRSEREGRTFESCRRGASVLGNDPANHFGVSLLTNRPDAQTGVPSASDRVVAGSSPVVVRDVHARRLHRRDLHRDQGDRGRLQRDLAVLRRARYALAVGPAGR